MHVGGLPLADGGRGLQPDPGVTGAHGYANQGNPAELARLLYRVGNRSGNPGRYFKRLEVPRSRGCPSSVVRGFSGHSAGAGVPVAEHHDFPASDPRPAVAFLETGCGPCVVKPGGATGAGYGVTCGVHNRGDLVRACLQAARFADTVLIERQAPGAMYRVLVLDGEPIAVVRRNPPQLTGDGSSSIWELLAAENRAPAGRRGAPGPVPATRRPRLPDRAAHGERERALGPAGGCPCDGEGL